MLCLFCTVTQWRMNTLKRNSPYIKLLTTSLCIFFLGFSFWSIWRNVWWHFLSLLAQRRVGGVFQCGRHREADRSVLFQKLSYVFHKFTEVVTHTSPGVFVVFLQKNLNLQLDRKKTQTAVSSVQLSEEELVLSEPRGCPAWPRGPS